MIKNKIVKLSILIAVVGLILLVVFVPTLNQRIIQDILLNGKTEIDDIFSGRISQTIRGFSNFKPVLGTGSSYIDCMPLSLLLTYGIVGFACLLPFSVLPIAMLISCCGETKDKRKKMFIILLLVLFFFEYLFEGFGYFGPGAKVFIFWMVAGFESNNFFKESKSKVFRRADSFSNKVANFINPFQFVVGLQTVLVALTVLTFIPSLFVNRLSTFLYNKVPSTAVVTEYNDPGVVKLASNNLSALCVGQRITYYLEAENKNCDDFKYCFSTSDTQKDNLIVNSERNEVMALRKSWSWCCYSSTRNGSGLLYCSIANTNEYTFDKFYISLNEYSYSFEHHFEESALIGIGASEKVYYDNYYVPTDVLVSFYTTNESVAVVDKQTGIVTGVGLGECDVYAVLNNDKKEFESVNKVHFSVMDEKQFVPCKSMILNYPSECFQYIPFAINPSFNEKVSNTKTIYEVKGIKYRMEDNSFVFLEPGNAIIKASSISNPLLSQEISIDVKENKPLSFSCNTKRLQVGNTYSPKELGLYVNYASGHSLLVNDKVLKYDPGDFRGRAWHETNGMVKDHCTIKAVKTGGVSLSLTSNQDENLNGAFHFDIIKYSNEKYDEIIIILSSVIIGLLSIVTMTFSLFINFKKRLYNLLAIVLLTALFCGMSLLFIGITSISLVFCSILLIVAVILSLLNKLLFKDNWKGLTDDAFLLVENDKE